MGKYNWDNIIINPDDPRIKIGDTYYVGDTPTDVLENANEKGLYGTLKSLLPSGAPFHVIVQGDDDYFPCLIRRGDKQ